MRFIKFLSSLLILCCCAFHGMAQDVEYDTATTKTETIVEAPQEETSADDEESDSDYVIDSTLISNGIVLSKDSIEQLKRSERFAYVRNLDSLLKASQKQPSKQDDPRSNEPSWIAQFFSARITQYIFWTIAGAFVVLILYKLFFTEGFFQRRSAHIHVKELSETPEDALVTPGDYSRLIAQAVAGQQYRLATRYHFLQSLYKLSSAGLLQLSADKTNDAYLHELDDHPLQHGFAALTRQYEYVWYGQFNINETVFAQLHEKFIAFNNQVK